MSQVYRVYVVKRKENAVEAKEIRHNIRHQLDMMQLEDVTVVNRYDLQGISEDVLNKGIPTILSEPMVDDVYLEHYDIPEGAKVFAIEYLPGQYDVRADFAAQCFQLLTGEKNVKVKCAKIIVLYGDLDNNDVEKVQKYLINPVDQRLANLEKVILYVTCEISEILGITDRVYVMYDGEIYKELETSKTSEEEILYYSTGGK